jgi:hypothetical protein
MDNQHEIIQTTHQEAGKLAPNIPNPLQSGITFKNDFGDKPLGLAHFTRDQGAIAIFSLAAAFVGTAFGGFPMAGAIILAGLNDIRYAGKLDERLSSPQVSSEPILVEVPAQVLPNSPDTPIEEEALNANPQLPQSLPVATTSHAQSQGMPPEPVVTTPALQVNIQAMLGMPSKERAIAILTRLNKDGFDVSRCIAEQITCICGNQRGGKGTLMAILAILCCAIDPATKIHYFTAGDDIYPFKCDRLVCRLNYPDLDGEQGDRKVAAELYKYLKQMDNGTQGSYQDIVLVIDEAVALSDYLSPDQKQWMIRFLLTRANKKGAQIFIVLHGINLTSWVGTGNTSGLSSTFKTGATFIGCEATSKKINPLRSISVATGRYFISSPDDFSKPMERGDLGVVPDWLKTEINPATGQPDPARTLLNFFPELASGNQVTSPSVEYIRQRLESLLDSSAVEPSPDPDSSPVQDSEPLNRAPEPLNQRADDGCTDLEDGSQFSSDDGSERFTPLNLTKEQALALIENLNPELNQTQIIERLWQVKKGGSAAWKEAREQFRELMGE